MIGADSGATESGAKTAKVLPSGTKIFWFVALLFVVSGFTSLIYQVIWTRLLVFVFGSTTLASSTVLAVFMGGLALGSFLSGKYCDHIKRPFLLYGILEGIIGLWAVLAPFLFDAALPVYKAAWQSFHLSVLPFSLIRFAIASAILLLPTACMGATLPLLSRFITTSLSIVGNRVGSLYAVNTLGAVLGAATAGFYLLPNFGLSASTYTAAALNVVLCLIVVASERGLFARAASREVPAYFGAPAGSDRRAEGKLPVQSKVAMAAFAVSGAVAMIYEVGWTRTLLLIIGSSTYAFTVMLCTFLVGIFVGSLAISLFVDRLKQPFTWFTFAQFLVCLGGLLSLHLFNFIPYLNLAINVRFLDHPEMAIGVRFLLSALVLMPITLCLGFIFPLVVKVSARDLQVVGRSVGTLYSANTLGAIVGAFAAGFVIVPLVGAERSLILASVANLLLGAVLLFFIDSFGKPIKILVAGACLPAIVWAATAPSIFDRTVILSAQMDRRILQRYNARTFPSYRDYKELLKGRKVLFWQDGACSTVGVVGYSDTPVKSLLTNGHVDASDGNDMSTQVLLGLYPLLAGKPLSDVAAIGWGSGVTVGTATLFPTKSITAIEIEKAVLEASKQFHHVNFEAEKNPHVTFEMNDGRNYMLATDKKFGVIISEPSNPWQAGVCNLFTREFFQTISQSLKKDGVFALWLQDYEVSTDNMREVLSALHSVFPHTLPLTANFANLIVLASQEPLFLDYARIEKLFQDQQLKDFLARSNIHCAADLLERIAASPDAVSQMTFGVPPNCDDLNRLEYEVGRTYEDRNFFGQNTSYLENHCGKPWAVVNWDNTVPEEKARIMAAVAALDMEHGHDIIGLKWAQESLRVHPNAEAMRLVAIARLDQGDRAAAQNCFQAALKIEPGNIPTLQSRGMFLLQAKEIAKARQDFSAVLAREPSNKAAAYHLALTYDPGTLASLSGADASVVRQSSPEDVLRYAAPVAEDSQFVSRHPDVQLMVALALKRTGKTAEAEKLLKRFLERKKDSVVAWQNLGSILLEQGRNVEASACWERSFYIGRQLALPLVDKARKLIFRHKETQALDALAEAAALSPADNQVQALLQEMSPGNPRAKAMLDDLSFKAVP